MNKIENTCLEPDVTKSMILREVEEFGAICIDANDLENTFEEDEFMNWLEENDLRIYESYTICKKGKYDTKKGGIQQEVEN
jgi:hypothetical protein